MNKYLKHILPLLITLTLAWLFFQRGISWNALRSVLIQAQWGWLLLALTCEAGAYCAVTWLNEILLQRYGIKVPYGKQLAVQLAMAFIEAALPSVSISGLVLRARLLKPHGVTPDVTTATSLAESTLITASVLLFALPVAGIAMMNGLNGLGNFDRLLLFFTGIAILIGITIWQWNSTPFANSRAQLFQWADRFWQCHIQSRWPLRLGDWSAKRVVERIRYLWVETIASVRARPYVILFSLLARFGFEALCLMMCFYALGQNLPIATLLFLYSLTIAISTLGAIPGGVGLAEVSLSALYAQFGIGTETALAIALVYRLIGYWIPRVAGGLIWIWLEQAGPRLHISESIP